MVSAAVRANLFRGRDHSCECQEAACTPLCTSAFQQGPLPATAEHSLSLLTGRHIPRGDAGPILHGWLSTLNLRKTPLSMELQNHSSFKVMEATNSSALCSRAKMQRSSSYPHWEIASELEAHSRNYHPLSFYCKCHH